MTSKHHTFAVQKVFGKGTLQVELWWKLGQWDVTAALELVKDWRGSFVESVFELGTLMTATG